MEIRKPVFTCGIQKAPDITSGMVEVAAAPFAGALIGKRMLIQRCSVILPQTIIIHREMHGDDIQNHADPVLMAGVDQPLQSVRIAVP